MRWGPAFMAHPITVVTATEGITPSALIAPGAVVGGTVAQAGTTAVGAVSASDGCGGGMNGRRQRYCALLWCFGTAYGAQNAPTQEAAHFGRELEPAWDVVASKVAQLVGEMRQRQLIDLAYASVGANVCGFALKRDAFQKAFDVFQDNEYRGMPEPQRKQYEQHLLIHYGTFVGLLTAEALLSRESFCETAAALKKARDGAGSYWDEDTATRKP